VAEFSLQAAIDAWRTELLAGGVPADAVRELHDHLCTGIERALEAGQAPAAGFAAVRAALGEPEALGREFTKERNMNPLSKLVGLSIAVAAIVVLMEAEGLHTATLFAWPPLLLVLGVAFGGLVAGHGPVRVWRTFASALGGIQVLPAEVAGLRDVCRRGQRLAYAGGLLQAILGTFHVLSVLDRPSMIGPGIAYAMLGLVHAVLIAELGFSSMERWIGRSASAEAVAG
jgi:hypothetical protein